MEARMAECVSCGKEIPQGKLFCDECYVKMKGRRGTLREVPKDTAGGTGVRDKLDEAREGPEEAGEAASPEEAMREKKASGTLTPTSGKKVISMKTDMDRGGREKGKGKEGKKKFTVTITFSERTYAALGRLKRSKRAENAAAGGTGTAAGVTATRRRARSKGPHGRAKLKAVTSATAAGGSEKKGFTKALGYRERAIDKGDLLAVAMAVFSTFFIIVLSFTNWVRITWVESEGAVMQHIEIKGTDLGATTYICMALVIVAFIYMVASWFLKGKFTRVDYGVVLIVAGLIFIPLLYSIIASNDKIFKAAVEIAGGSGGSVPEAAQFERQTLWTAYAMVLMGSILSLSGLVRLAERRGGGTPPA
jgi:hypothetical protein